MKLHANAPLGPERSWSKRVIEEGRSLAEATLIARPSLTS